MDWASLAVSPFPEDAFAGFSRWIYNFLRDHERILVAKRSRLREKFGYNFLRDHERILVAKRSRLREKFGGANAGAHSGVASVQRDAELDVFPQLTPERSRFHAAFYYLHEPGPKH